MQTLLTPVVIEGIGLHSGQPARVELQPVTTPTGRIFYRDGVQIPALVEYVVDTHRCTMLGHAGVTISTVEHLLAALLLAGVDHVAIYLNGPELPALDGAALAWYSAIINAGVAPIDGEVPTFTIKDACWIEEGHSQFYLYPAKEFLLHAAISIADTAIDHVLVGGIVGEQTVNTQILRARTYCLERDVQAILADGLAKGGSLTNAVVLTETGYLNEQVWPDEPAWHKVLDLLGDLALVGVRLQGHIVAVQAGHRSHVALAQRLRRLYCTDMAMLP